MADDFARQLLDALYNPESPQQPAQPQQPQQRRIAQLYDPERLRRLGGIGEAALTIGTGYASGIPAGLAGLAQMIPTRGRVPDVNKAAQTVEDIQGALTYLPRGETGQRVLQKVAKPLEMLGAPAEYLAEKTFEKTGSPLAATFVGTAGDPMNLVGLPGSGRAIAATTRAAGRAAAAAPRVAGEMISDLVMPTPRAQAQRGAIDLGPQIPEFQPQTALGLVSRADEALAAMPRNKGTGAEFLRELEKTPGVRMAELEDRGLVEALSGMGKVTKADVIKALQDNPPVQLKEVMLGSESLTPRQKLTIEYDRAREESGRVGGSTNPSYIERIPESNRTPEEQRLLEAWNRVDQSLEESWLSENPPPKYGQYTLPGGENYREILLTLPVKKPSEKDVRLEPRTANFGGSGEGFNAYIGDAFIGSGRTQDEALANALRNAPDDILQNYRSGHWNEPNVLAHARISDRTGPNGEKILHVEEVQSDWHQTGRKSGYKTGKEEQQLDEAKWQYSFNKGMQQDFYRFAEGLPEGDPQRLKYLQQANDLTPKLMKLDSEISRIRQAMEEGVPDAPFKKNWHELMMRRLVDYAAKNGYDRIAITPGAEQASRYDLSKQVDELLFQKNQDGTYKLSAQAGGRGNMLGEKIPENKLSDYVGKEVAEKIVGNSGKEINLGGSGSVSQPADMWRSLSGLDLKIGGEGMRGFYDKILPTYLNELGKPYGVKVGQIEIEIPGKEKRVFERIPGEIWSKSIQKPETFSAHSFDITPQMREAIKSKGLPLYAKGGSVHISDNPDTMALELAGGGKVGPMVEAAKRGAKAVEKQAAKAAEKEALAVPYDIPRAPPKTKEEIRAVAERMAKQMTDEFVRPDPKKSVNVAGKTFEQFKREKGFEKDYVTRPTKDVTPPEVADIEKQKGVVKFGIPGDTTIANRELLQAGPYRLEDPSPQHGGPMFPLGGEGAWASNNPIAKNVQTRIGEMGRFFDAPVLGQYMSMGPAGSMFAQHLADANLQAIDLKSMGDRKIEQFNKLLRRGNEKTGPRESFPGIQDKAEAYLYFAFDPKLRIYFNELMQMPSVTQALKLPDGRVILDAITEPELRNKEIMTSGLSQFQFDPNIKPEDIPLSMHPTYTHLIPMKEGAPVTRTRYPTPAELEFSDVANFIRQNYPAKEFTRVMQTGSPRQKIDQQAIDEIKMYEEMMKSLTGKKKGGAVKKQAGGAIKAAVKAAKPTAEQAATMSAQRAEMVLRSRAMQELKDQFENLPQPPKGFLSPESILQRMDEIRRREATPSGEQIPLLKKGGAIEMQAGGALKAAAKAAEKAAAQTAFRQAAEQTVKSIYPQADALERARQNAVKMLGLPENNTAMDRARAMGFVHDQLFHGTVNDFPAFKVSDRSSVYATDSPAIADIYANATGRHKGLREVNASPNVMPLMYRGKLLEVSDQGKTGGGWLGDNLAAALGTEWRRNLVKEVPSKGYSGIKVKDMDDLGGRQSQYIFPDPIVLRSRFAAFDPAEMDKPGLLKKNGGAAHKPAKKVAITDNLDTMRLAVQKRK